jgi:phenylacetyl-CoA:acceptor oxidoreductase subunit 2
MGSGLAVVAAFLRLAGGLADRAFLALAALSGLLIAAGLLFVFFEIGWKSRALLALRRPQSSWMTREIYAVLAFYAVLFADIAAPRAPLHVAVGLAAAGFLLCQARILLAGKGIPAWLHPAIPWLIAVSGLLEGSGLALAATALAGAAPALLGALGLALTAGAAALWTWYRLTAERHGIGATARRALTETTPWLHAFGHVVPALGFLAALVAPSAGVLLAVGGLAAAAGGAAWKFAVVTRAAHQQGFTLPKLPQRGSGARAAPARL